MIIKVKTLVFCENFMPYGDAHEMLLAVRTTFFQMKTCDVFVSQHIDCRLYYI